MDKNHQKHIKEIIQAIVDYGKQIYFYIKPYEIFLSADIDARLKEADMTKRLDKLGRMYKDNEEYFSNYLEALKKDPEYGNPCSKIALIRLLHMHYLTMFNTGTSTEFLTKKKYDNIKNWNDAALKIHKLDDIIKEFPSWDELPIYRQAILVSMFCDFMKATPSLRSEIKSVLKESDLTIIGKNLVVEGLEDYSLAFQEAKDKIREIFLTDGFLKSQYSSFKILMFERKEIEAMKEMTLEKLFEEANERIKSNIDHILPETVLLIDTSLIRGKTLLNGDICLSRDLFDSLLGKHRVAQIILILLNELGHKILHCYHHKKDIMFNSPVELVHSGTQFKIKNEAGEFLEISIFGDIITNYKIDNKLIEMIVDEKWDEEGIKNMREYIPTLVLDSAIKECGNHGSRSNNIQAIKSVCGKIFNQEYQKALEEYYALYYPR